MRKEHKRILIGVAIVIVVLGSLYAIALAKAQARLRRAYAALEADGRPMLAVEVIPPPIPEAENAAPLFVAAARPLKELAKSFIYDLLDRLQTFAHRFVDGSIHPEDLEFFKGYMEQDVVKNSLQLFEQGLQRPKCRFNRDYDKGLWVDPLGLWVDPHEAGNMRSLLRIRRAKSDLRTRLRPRKWRHRGTGYFCSSDWPTPCALIPYWGVRQRVMVWQERDVVLPRIYARRIRRMHGPIRNFSRSSWRWMM